MVASVVGVGGGLAMPCPVRGCGFPKDPCPWHPPVHGYADPARRVSADTRRANVLDRLKAQEWVSGPDLCHPDVGGSEGLRRLRELRAAGYAIEKRKRMESDAYEYRLR
jgi:hypothetical protein